MGMGHKFEGLDGNWSKDLSRADLRYIGPTITDWFLFTWKLPTVKAAVSVRSAFSPNSRARGINMFKLFEKVNTKLSDFDEIVNNIPQCVLNTNRRRSLPLLLRIQYTNNLNKQTVYVPIFRQSFFLQMGNSFWENMLYFFTIGNFYINNDCMRQRNEVNCIGYSH